MGTETVCRRCSESFDYRESTCPHGGWSRGEWVADWRYGLGRPVRGVHD
ncbi:hypothetical protein [Haloplanus pelagicus]|nr:hypothetical protein [Haloplanus sp. HW8-1]